MSEAIKLMWPCDHNQVVNTCDFACHKSRPGYKGSLANDLASKGGIGLPIVAEQNNGVVTVAGWDTTGYGNVVKVAYLAGRLVCQTAHLASIAVKAGDKVHAGYALGIMGTTGNSTGVHTHWAVWLDGKNIDPLDPRNNIVMVNTVAELDGEVVPPPVEPPVVTPPSGFVLPDIPIVPSGPTYKPTAIVTSFLRVRGYPKDGPIVGSVYPGDMVRVIGYTDVADNIWFMVKLILGDTVGWVAAYYNGETWLEPVK